MKLLVKNISKHIGKKEILKDISIELESGKVYGFVGKNGSGTLRFLSSAARSEIRLFKVSSRILPSSSKPEQRYQYFCGILFRTSSTKEANSSQRSLRWYRCSWPSHLRSANLQ